MSLARNVGMWGGGGLGTGELVISLACSAFCTERPVLHPMVFGCQCSIVVVGDESFDHSRKVGVAMKARSSNRRPVTLCEVKVLIPPVKPRSEDHGRVETWRDA